MVDSNCQRSKFKGRRLPNDQGKNVKMAQSQTIYEQQIDSGRKPECEVKIVYRGITESLTLEHTPSLQLMIKVSVNNRTMKTADKSSS